MVAPGEDGKEPGREDLVALREEVEANEREPVGISCRRRGKGVFRRLLSAGRGPRELT